MTTFHPQMNASCRIPATAVGGDLDIILQKCRIVPRVGPRFSEDERVEGTYCGATNAEQNYKRNVFNQSFVANRTAAYKRRGGPCPPRFIPERARLAIPEGADLKAEPYRGDNRPFASKREPGCPRGVTETQRLRKSFLLHR